MDRLNYHHLHYFWLTAREGTVSRASALLRLSQPTLSAQIRALETALGEKLFQRAGRRLELTDVGRLVFSYADEIFSLGREMTDTLASRVPRRPLRLQVGVADVMPKLVAYRLVEPALRLADPVRVVVREGPAERLLSALITHDLDIVLSDAPAGPGARVNVYNHLLGTCGIVLLAATDRAAALRRRFPESLDGAPFLLPTAGAVLRRTLDDWFARRSIQPRIVGEFDDTALIKVFGESGAGVFAAPAAIEREVRRQHRVARIGVLDGAREEFYAISTERRLVHPAVVAISDGARRRLFPQ